MNKQELMKARDQMAEEYRRVTLAYFERQDLENCDAEFVTSAEVRGYFRGFDARDRMDLEAPEVVAMRDALRYLASEAGGFIQFADPANHGNTNIAVMKNVIKNAEQALEAYDKARASSR